MGKCILYISRVLLYSRHIKRLFVAVKKIFNKVKFGVLIIKERLETSNEKKSSARSGKSLSR